MSDVDAIKKTLFADYDIEFGRELSAHIRGLSEQEKEEWSHRVAVKNLFLIRRINDPGAFNRALSEATKDPAVMNFITTYIKSAYYGEKRPGLLGPMPLSDKRKGIRANIGLAKPMFLPNEAVLNSLFNTLPLDVIGYFKERYKLAEKRQDLDEMTALRWQIADYTTGMSNSHLLFGGGLASYATQTSRLRLRTQKYLTQHLRLIDLYDSVGHTDSILKRASIPSSVLSEHLLSILRELGELRGETSSEDMAEWSKYLSDALSVMSIRWFDSMELEDQIDFLNRTYPLVDQEQLDAITQGPEDQRYLMFIAKLLYQEGYIGESEAICRHVLKRAASKEIEYMSTDSVGSILREYGDYDQAKVFFKKALELAEGLDLYKYALELKNLGEMEVRTKNAEIGYSLLSESMAIAGEIPAKERSGILLNIAYAFRRLEDFEKEYAILGKIMEEGRLERTPIGEVRALDPLLQVTERLILLNEPQLMTSRYRIDKDKLLELEREGRLKTLKRVSDSMFRAFQLEGSRNYLRMMLRERSNDSVIMSIAESYYEQGRYEEAESVLISLDHDARERPFYQLVRGLCAVKRGDQEGGLPLIRRAIVPVEDSDWDLKPRLAEYAINQLARSADEGLLRVSIDYLLAGYARKGDKAVFLRGVASTLSGLGYYQLPLDLLNELTRWELKAKERSDIYVSIGAHLNVWGSNEDAHRHFVIASKLNPDSITPYIGEACSKASRNDYAGALESMSKAIRMDPARADLIQLQELWTAASREVVFTSGIKDDNVRDLVLDADKRYEGTKGLRDPPKDCSTIITDYGRSAEAMLHQSITMKVRDQLIDKYAENKISQERVWVKNEFMGTSVRAESRSIQDLAKVIRTGETISLGAWSHILRFDDRQISNPILRTFNEWAAERYSKGEIETIRRCTKALALIRNDATHPSKCAVMSREEMVAQREKIVPLMNELIVVLYENQRLKP